MKDTLCVTKKRIVKEVELILEDNKLLYIDPDTNEELPLKYVFTPFIGDTCTVTIVNKNESDDISVEEIDVEDE